MDDEVYGREELSSSENGSYDVLLMDLVSGMFSTFNIQNLGVPLLLYLYHSVCT